jgi:hypothetical protein
MPTSSYRFAILLALVVSPMPFAAAQPPPLTRPHLMVVGTAHFANRNLDLADINVDDVLSPDRQKQMEDLVSALARYRPTRIAVEITPDKQAELNARYLDYRAGKYTLKRDEVDQIAFRLAAKLNLAQVDAVNDFDPPPGSQEAYDVASFAEANGQKSRWDVYVAHAQQMAAADTAYLRSHTLSAWFRHANEPASLAALNLPYYEKATFGDWKQHPGANWVGGWYARNLTIFSNLRRISSPNDRVLVLFGDGHAYFLNQFATESGAFVLERPSHYLRRGTASLST